MDQSDRTLGTFDRHRLYVIARRWVPVLFAAAVVGGVAAFAVSKLTPPTYEASAELYLAPAASNPTGALQDVSVGLSLATSYVELAKAEVVLRPSMERVGWTGDLRVFRGSMDVSQVRNTLIINVTFRDRDPQLAAAAANAIADAFIAQSRNLQASLQGTAVTQLEQQIKGLGDDIDTLTRQIGTIRATLAASPEPSPSARADLQAQIVQLDTTRQAKQQTLAQLLKTRDDMRLAQARAETTVSLWQPATVPDEPVAPRTSINTILGAVAGALVALLGVAFVTYFDDRLADIEDIRERLGAAPLGQLRLHEHPETMTGKLFIRDQSSSPEAEAIRGIRTNIIFASVDARPRTLLVTSALPGEGKSVLSANLALAFAEAGAPVVLLDADLRRPAQHRLFRLSAAYGLTNLLTEGNTAVDLQRFRVSPQLTVVPSGPLPPNPAELLGSGRMSRILLQIAAAAPNGMVIIDSSPVLAVADPVALSTKVDGCIVVVDSSRTRVVSTRRALAALDRVHASLLGVVLNKLTEREPSDYRYQAYYRRRPTATTETTKTP